MINNFGIVLDHHLMSNIKSGSWSKPMCFIALFIHLCTKLYPAFLSRILKCW